MNVFKEYRNYNKEIVLDEIDDTKRLKIEVLSTDTDRKKTGVFKFVTSSNKHFKSCNDEERKLCDRVCRNDCLLFENIKDKTNRIWSCYIKSWKIL